MPPALRPQTVEAVPSGPAEPPAAIEFADVSLAFPGDRETILALDRVSITAPKGQITTVVGPSGCGKTTLLRLVAGLLKPSAGRTLCNGREVRSLNAGIGFVTQESNLFPWATAIDNVQFPLVVRGVPARERRARAREWIDAVGLSGFENSYPAQLSGGMQKRVAIARTFIYEPEVILLDEPFGALDAQTRMMLHHQLLQLWDKRRMTMLFITHDLVEAITLSDHVVVLTTRPGRVKERYRVPLPRPRNVIELQKAPEFGELVHRIWSGLRDEVQRAREQENQDAATEGKEKTS